MTPEPFNLCFKPIVLPVDHELAKSVDQHIKTFDERESLKFYFNKSTQWCFEN